ncbi:MAG: ATP-dependent Clp protease adapter ClpS [Alphaproteobacteria bacterium]|nr:ATP-dependent Clp protease adapter ClpS [Alphaproteobacteria bacterium]
MSLDDENTTHRVEAQGENPGGGIEEVSNDTLLLVEPEVKTKRPPFFKVVLLNDDFTPMDFVVFVLKDIFRKNHEEAVSTMLDVHHKGAGICGVYTRDVAETKAELVVTLARRNEYPLQCRVEKE